MFLLLLLTRCADVEPLPVEACDASRLDGVWQDSKSPFWVYEFDYPRLTQWLDIGGTVPVKQEYIYGTKADSLWASGPGGERLWSVCFLNDSTAEYREWNVFKWSPASVLKRR